jgi:hypothetical protein
LRHRQGARADIDGQSNYPAPVFVNSQTDKANQLW